MTFCIITHVNHGQENNSYFAYSPYVKEMNIWTKFIGKLIIVAPLNLETKKAIEIPYTHQNIKFIQVPTFNFLSLKSTFKTLLMLPFIALNIFKAMKQSDHIHLRCPGNMGLLACIVQVFFPKKIKTAKYAGNWDLNSKQPLSYRIQKWILNSTFLTKNMTVLVYGEWENSSKNIKSFFTATYEEKDKNEIKNKNFSSTISFVFIGSLTSGKNPLYAIQIIEQLFTKGFNVKLSIYGTGVAIEELNSYINKNQLSSYVHLMGNKNQQEIKEVYINSHFVILPSKSEGWPKVIAEGMFWKCLPIATKVSCVPNMLENGERGILLNMNLEKDVYEIEKILLNEKLYQEKVDNAVNWSRLYTIEFFEDEIKKLIY
jgi:glycosyltransferase involved in cell wall biosynthesis